MTTKVAIQDMDKINTNRYQDENPMTPIVSEPVVAYGYRRDTVNTQNVILRNDINTAIDGEELLSRLRPRIKSLFK